MTPLTATYISPPSPLTTRPQNHTLTHLLPTLPPSPTTPQKTAYLSALRSSLLTLQDEINTLLTQKMEEDKAGGAGGAVDGVKVDEVREEENYGEEAVGED